MMAPIANGNITMANGVAMGAGKTKQRPVIVPVIPLPLMQRKQAAPKAVMTATTPSTTVPTTPASMTSTEPATYPAETGEVAPITVSPLESPQRVPVAPAANGAPPSPTSDIEPTKDIIELGGNEAVDLSNGAANTDENTSVKEVVLESNTPSSVESPPTNTTTPMPAEPAFSQPAPHQPLDAAPGPALVPASHATVPQARYQMPPAFQPPTRNGDAPRPMRLALDRQLPPHVHGHTSSNGSAKLQFGGFPDTPNNPSPAPHPGGIAPPPGIPLDSRQPSGYGPGPHPGMPFRHDVNVDGYGRHGAGFPPHANHFGPSTPHSFQGSQASAQDENTVYGTFPSGPAVNNAPVAGDEPRMYTPTGYPSMMPPMPPHHMMHMVHQEADGLRDYVKGAFDDPLLTDCILKLSLPNLRDAATIAGHRLILARSPVLRNLMLHDRAGLANGIINIDAEDRNVRADSFFLAIRRLYGYELFVPPPTTGNKAAAGSLMEKFNYTLGYAAAGHLLQWESVTLRGMEVAARLLEWPVLERALEFVLGGTASRGAIDNDSRLQYGEPSRILISAIIDFLITNFPPNFILDTTVGDPESYARLPDIMAASPTSPRNNAPIARGTSVHRPRLSHIKFGDMAPASPVSHVPPFVQAILSRVLLNLPFVLLKPVLESVLSGNMGYANADVRQQIAREVLAEREKRRLRVVDAVLGSRVPAAAGIQRGLQSMQPRTLDEWDVLGWVEEIGGIYDSSGAPSLMRAWKPLRDVHGINMDEQPMYP